MIKQNLNGYWKLRQSDNDEEMRAFVPGSVCYAMLENGKIQDPFYRENAQELSNILSHDYIYSCEFNLEGKMNNCSRIVLCCEGIDTLYSLMLNGKDILHGDNMHRTYEIDVTNMLNKNSNTISVMLRQPIPFVEKKEREEHLPTCSTVWGSPYLRKASFMFGWDWSPVVPDMGIWREISLIGFQDVKLSDLYVSQEHSAQGVKLNVSACLEQWNDWTGTVSVELISPDGEKNEKIVDASDLTDNTFKTSFYIEQPQIWWPNTYGNQPLYKVSVKAVCGEMICDELEKSIGLRTLTVCKEKDDFGESFCFEINGIKIFAMGADYIPEDYLLTRCSKKRTERLIHSCINANFNCIRVWGGGIYPDDYFYELCDKYGLIVWQDFMFACSVYSLEPKFLDSTIAEFKYNIKRLRNHPCLGLWCGNNEQELAWIDWGWYIECSEKLKADYLHLYEKILPDIIAELDPQTFYWPASPSSGGNFDIPNDENRGDMHYWRVWHGKKPISDYRNIFPRFISEFGMQSFPNYKTVNSYTEAEDRNIFSPVMEEHQKSAAGNERIVYYESLEYRMPTSFEGHIYLSQVMQAEGVRCGIEHWRRNRGRCMGAIYWQLNDCCPVASWSSIDYYGRWKALHYAAKKFYSPFLLSACEDKKVINLYLTNDKRCSVSGKLRWWLRHNNGEICTLGERCLSAGLLSTQEILKLDFSDKLLQKQELRSTYLEFNFTTGTGEVSGGTCLFVPAKEFSFENPHLRFCIDEEENAYVVRISSSSFAKFVCLDVKSFDIVFSDNYFDISVGETKNVSISKSQFPNDYSKDQLINELYIYSLWNSFN